MKRHSPWKLLVSRLAERKLSLRNICETIARYAFVTSPYPIIISAEVHCSVPQQVMIASIMCDVFGDALVKAPADGPLKIEILPSPEDLKGKVLLISGGSRGIGLEIALRAARDGAAVALLAKTDVPHPRLEGTIHTAAAAIEAAGGEALPVVGDVRDEDSIRAAVAATAER